jgi:hypothetical protein
VGLAETIWRFGNLDHIWSMERVLRSHHSIGATPATGSCQLCWGFNADFICPVTRALQLLLFVCIGD